MHLPDKKLHVFPSPHSFLQSLNLDSVGIGLVIGGFTQRLVDILHILFIEVQSCLHGLSAKISSLFFLGLIQRPVLVLQILLSFSQFILHCFFLELEDLLLFINLDIFN